MSAELRGGRPPEDWCVFTRELSNGTVATLAVDIGLRLAAPLPDAPTLLRIDMVARTQRDNGYPTTKEYDSVIYPLEDALANDLARVDPSIAYAGKSTIGQSLSFFFYGSPSTAVASKGIAGRLFGSARVGVDPRPAAIEAVFARYSGYRPSIEISDDRDWSIYATVLCPNQQELDTINDNKVLSQLLAHGDDTTKPRDIDHFVICPDEASHAEIIQLASVLGFRVNSSRTDDGRYAVELVRRDAPDEIFAVAAPLREAAGRLGAEYDGWGCPLAS